jgi:hypothetical protein
MNFFWRISWPGDQIVVRTERALSERVETMAKFIKGDIWTCVVDHANFDMSDAGFMHCPDWRDQFVYGNADYPAILQGATFEVTGIIRTNGEWHVEGTFTEPVKGESRIGFLLPYDLVETIFVNKTENKVKELEL